MYLRNQRNVFPVYQFMSLHCNDYVSWLMRTNYYMQINHLPESMHYKNTTNISMRFQPVTHGTCLHYLKDLQQTQFHHIILQSLFLLLGKDATSIDSYYYISITNDESCEFDEDRFAFYSTTTTMRYTIEVSLHNQIRFHGPVLYFQSMYYRIDISTNMQKQCDAVLSFQLVFKDRSQSLFYQGHCAMDYIQVC